MSYFGFTVPLCSNPFSFWIYLYTFPLYFLLVCLKYTSFVYFSYSELHKYAAQFIVRYIFILLDISTFYQDFSSFNLMTRDFKNTILTLLCCSVSSYLNMIFHSWRVNLRMPLILRKWFISVPQVTQGLHIASGYILEIPSWFLSSIHSTILWLNVRRSG